MASTVALWLSLLVAPARAAPEANAGVPTPADDLSSRLRPPSLSFRAPSTLHILDRGRFGTWSLMGSSFGCLDAAEISCLDVATAWLGVAWRPIGTRLSLFAGLGVSSAGSVPNAPTPVGARPMVGVSIELPSRRGWSLLRRR